MAETENKETVSLPASVEKALAAVVFSDRHCREDNKPRTAVQLPNCGSAAWLQSPEADEAALTRAFPELDKAQIGRAVGTLRQLFKRHLAQRRYQRRSQGNWVTNW